MTSDNSAALAERVFKSVLGTMETFSIYLGDRLGLYTALRATAASTARELAERSGCNERYVREWLEQQGVAGLLQVDAVSREPDMRRYSLPPAAAEVLADPESLNYMSAVVRLVVSTAKPMPEILTAFRNGGGVPWSSYGIDAREGQADVNKPIFLQLLGEWFSNVEDIEERLRAEPPARVADIGCGGGWSTIAIANHFPLARVDGIDVDEPSIELARSNMATAGLDRRVAFKVMDAGDASLSGLYDLVTVFEAIHDMSRPVEVLTKIRNLLTMGGSVLVIDERVAESFTAPGDEIEQVMYGWSILCCLATGMSEKPSAETGTVMRPSTLKSYAAAAGFSQFDSIEIGHPFFRMYRLKVQ